MVVRCWSYIFDRMVIIDLCGYSVASDINVKRMDGLAQQQLMMLLPNSNNIVIMVNIFAGSVVEFSRKCRGLSCTVSICS